VSGATLTPMTDRILVLNGPNLGRLGSREPDVYGSADLESLRAALTEDAARAAGATGGTGDAAPVAIDLRQTDDESELIHWLHEAVDNRTPVILNPAAFTHYSYGLRDAAAQLHTVDIPLVEVHISNPHARERFRHTSVISGVATGVIAGFGFDSYRLALHYLLTR
jgi:3-dehydroquinate dehydratase-2